MDSKQLIQKVSVNDIIGLMTNYFHIPFLEEDYNNTEYIRFLTLCHHMDDPSEASYKLYFYRQSKSFYCFSNCGSMSLFDLVMQLKDITFSESVEFLENYFHLGIGGRGFGRPKFEKEIEPYIPKKVDFNEKLPLYTEYALNTLVNHHPIEWLNEGITQETMTKYEIKYDIYTDGIIIPHRDNEGGLVGIRQRNLDKRQVEMYGRKYVPYTDIRNKHMYKHKLSMCLYGLWINKSSIQDYKKCIIFESEKSVLKMDSAYNGANPCVSVGGSTVSEYQLNLLRELGVNDVYLAFDKETEKGEAWEKKMTRICNRIIDNGFNCYVIKDEIGLLDEKESPIDRGRDKFEILLKNSKMYIDK